MMIHEQTEVIDVFIFAYFARFHLFLLGWSEWCLGINEIADYFHAFCSDAVLVHGNIVKLCNDRTVHGDHTTAFPSQDLHVLARRFSDTIANVEGHFRNINRDRNRGFLFPTCFTGACFENTFKLLAYP